MLQAIKLIACFIIKELFRIDIVEDIVFEMVSIQTIKMWKSAITNIRKCDPFKSFKEKHFILPPLRYRVSLLLFIHL